MYYTRIMIPDMDLVTLTYFFLINELILYVCHVFASGSVHYISIKL